MPRRQPMPLEEREICRRLRDFRLKTGLSQAQFAVLAGLNPRAYAGFEYERTQLNYPATQRIMDFFHLPNPLWLVEGIGSMTEIRAFRFPEAETLEVGQRALFSSVFNRRLRPNYLKATILRPVNPLNPLLPIRLFFFDASPQGRMNNLTRFADLHRNLIAELPGDKVANFLNEIFLSTASIFARYPKDNEMSAVDKRKLDMYEIEARRRFPSEENCSENRHLTDTTTPDKTLRVQNQWHRLKLRIQKITADSGGKSDLAKFLGVDLTQLSKWLTDSESAREPGADYALKMLLWVQERESQQ